VCGLELGKGLAAVPRGITKSCGLKKEKSISFGKTKTQFI
jgi:hypothetical protein